MTMSEFRLVETRLAIDRHGNVSGSSTHLTEDIDEVNLSFHTVKIATAGVEREVDGIFRNRRSTAWRILLCSVDHTKRNIVDRER